MNKIISYFMFLMVILVSPNGFSMNQPIKALALTNYNLEPGKALTLVNTLPNTLTVRCLMTVVSSQNHSISIKGLSGSGQINGTSLSKGQTMVQTVQNMQVIPITASSGAKAEFTNLGPYTVTTSCG